MVWLRKWADRLIRLSAFFGALGLAVILVTILIDVIGRAFGAPLYGSHDIITMTMVVLVFGGMAICDRMGGHIAVDLLERHYPPGMNRAIDCASALAGAVIFATLAAAILDSAKLSQLLNLSTNLLHLPRAWFQQALGVFSLITAAGMLLRAAEIAFCGVDIRPQHGVGGDDAAQDSAKDSAMDSAKENGGGA